MSPSGNPAPEWAVAAAAGAGGPAAFILHGAEVWRLEDVAAGAGRELLPAGELADRLVASGRFDVDALSDLVGAARRRGARPIEAGLPARLEPPVRRPGKIIALGRTYPAHARELGNEPPAEPLMFAKLPENMVGAGATVLLPPVPDGRFDNEIELAVVIGASLRRAGAEEAEGAIAGYTIVNDLTWRSRQKEAQAAGHPWFLAKNLPGALPVGPWLVPRALVENPRGLRITCRINGRVTQDASTEGLMASPAELLSWVSGRVPLHAGDIVSLGTPKGVTTIRPGDRVEASIEGLGTLTTCIEEDRS